MRIVGGKYKRRRFDVPKSFNARPTTDFAKENLFNVLQGYLDLEGCSALDLFAGTGSISAELLSRGCAPLVAVEQRREHARFINEVVAALGEKDQTSVYQMDVARFISLQQSKGCQYDFIFADPPYKLTWLAKIPQLVIGIDVPTTDEVSRGEEVEAPSLLSSQGVFVLEHPDSYNFSAHPLFVEQRAYGAVNFSIFCNTATI